MTDPLRMLDTGAAVGIICGAAPGVRSRLARVPVNRICISAMTRAELAHGLSRMQNVLTIERTRGFLQIVQTLPWDETAADEYGRLVAIATNCHAPIGDKDIAVAAHAISARAVLVTHEPGKFAGLQSTVELEDWSDT